MVIIKIGVLVERGTPPLFPPREREPRSNTFEEGSLGRRGEEDTLLVIGKAVSRWAMKVLTADLVESWDTGIRGRCQMVGKGDGSRRTGRCLTAGAVASGREIMTLERTE